MTPRSVVLLAIFLRPAAGDAPYFESVVNGNGDESDGMCLGTYYGKQDPGTQAIIFACNGHDDQQWDETKIGDGILQNKAGMCLDTQNGNTGPTTNVVINKCNGANSQKWTYDGSPPHFVNGGGMCLGTYYGGTAGGTNVILFNCLDNSVHTDQQWTYQAWLPPSAGSPILTESDEHDKAFKEFEQKFKKDYANDIERMQRFQKFKATYDFIKIENAKDHKYKLAINEFSDESPEEFAKSHFGYKKPEKQWGSLKSLGTHVYDGAPLADSIDWVAKGAVTPVKNQGQCGSCWSFSTTGSLEGAWEIATGKLVSLSEEMLVDCSKQNHGCGGGSMDLAFQYVEQNGLCTEKSYPYIAGGGHAGTCKASSCTLGLAKGAVTGFKDVDHGSKEALMSALMKGPVSIAVEADKSVFQSYRSGVMTGMCGTNLDHGILAVGYGTDSGTDYWKVKNSWGDVWGMSGYGNLERGKGGVGECGILSDASYPVVSGKPGPSPGPSPPTPPTPPTPPSPGTSHYEKPPCQSDEVDAQIQGIDGSVCAPKCTSSSCPTDVPTGTKDTPSCCLQDSSSGDKYCALECAIGGCPPGAACKHPSGSLMGICIYPSSNVKDTKTQVKFVPTQREITV